jgi:hypothetical protein
LATQLGERPVCPHIFQKKLQQLEAVLKKICKGAESLAEMKRYSVSMVESDWRAARMLSEA